MHIPRVLAAFFLFIVVIGAILAFIFLPGMRYRAASPATVSNTLSSEISLSNDADVRELTMTAEFDATTYEAGDRAVLTTRITNSTTNTITVRYANACVEPTLTSNDELTTPSRVCAQATTYVIFHPGQVLTQTQSVYLQSSTGNVAMPLSDINVLQLRPSIDSYTITANWRNLHSSASLGVSASY